MSDDPERPQGVREAASDDLRPLRDRDTTIEERPEDDPAQVEWDRTTLADAGEESEPAATATGDDPAQIPDDLDEIPRDDLAPGAAQPETQGEDPVVAELGEDGQGDLAPEDL